MNGEYYCKKYKGFVSNIFCAENIFMDNKYILLLKKRKKKCIFSVIFVPNL